MHRKTQAKLAMHAGLRTAASAASIDGSSSLLVRARVRVRVRVRVRLRVSR